MKLNEKRVLITGGGSGIGLALAEAMARLGARIAITGRRESALAHARDVLNAKGIDVATVQADVASAQDRSRSIAQAVALLGGVDILVNNAGSVRAGRLELNEPEAIMTMLNTNLVGPIFLTRELLPELRKSGESLVINISSGIGKIGMPFYSVYAATKAGIAQFGNALRRELDGEGVGVLNVFPVATDTPMMHSVRGDLRFDDAGQVAAAIVEGVLNDAREVVRGDENRLAMNALELSDPAAVDVQFRQAKSAMEENTRTHRSL